MTAAQRDDAGIERAAMALCFAARPVLTVGPPSECDRQAWWQMQSEMDRRLYLYRARIAVDAWERYWETGIVATDFHCSQGHDISGPDSICQSCLRDARESNRHQGAPHAAE